MTGLRWLVRNSLLILTIENMDEFPSTEKWKKCIEDFMSRGYRKVIIDVGRLTHINTTVLTFLVFVAQGVQEYEGKCSLCSPHGRVLNVLKTTNLDRLLAIHTDLDSAIEALSLDSAE